MLGSQRTSYKQPDAMSYNMPYGSYSGGTFTFDPQNAKAYGELQQRRLQTLEDLGISMPYRLAQNREWQNTMFNQIDPSQQVEETMQRKGMMGTPFISALGDATQNAKEQAFLQSYGLAQNERNASLNRFNSIGGQLNQMNQLGLPLAQMGTQADQFNQQFAYNKALQDRVMKQKQLENLIQGIGGTAALVGMLGAGATGASPMMLSGGGGMLPQSNTPIGMPQGTRFWNAPSWARGNS